MVDAGGGLQVVHPRRRDSVDVGLTDTVTEPVDLELRIARMVETALARALPAVLGATARELGPPSTDNDKQPDPLALQPGPGIPLTDDTTHTDTPAPVARQPGLGVQLIDAHPVQPTSARPAQDSSVGVPLRDHRWFLPDPARR